MNVSPHRILVIEDNRADVMLVEEALAMHGIEAEMEVIPDGEEAIVYFETRKPHALELIVLDLNLPKKDGHEILAHVRADAKYSSVPVLIMTSSDSQKDRDEATRLGCNGYFRKPTRFDEFLNIGKLIKDLMR